MRVLLLNIPSHIDLWSSNLRDEDHECIKLPFSRKHRISYCNSRKGVMDNLKLKD